ncbi:MAG: alkaline phosphatase family protein, partial [Candidatus Micrarchaeota archaeon]|nr:alkaline phosphatase family protein [Candidatus Micrarchaeota archaeon]
ALKKKGYIILPEEVYQKNNEARLIKEMHAMIDVQRQTALELVENEWDFFFFVYFATDKAGHWFWKHMDDNHPLHRKRDAPYADTILDVYKKMDDAVGKLIAKAGPNATVILVSDHGMGPLHKDVFINNWLMREGFMRLKPRALTRLKKALHDAGFTLENAYGVAQRLNVAKATAASGEAAEKARRFLLDHFFISFHDVDWSKTVAFSATNYGPIFINLQGRQREGIVSAQEYEDVRNRIISKMGEFTDPDGKPVFEKIWKKEELIHGPHSPQAPDIVFQITDMKYTSNRYFEFASNQLFGKPHRDMSGDHRNDGIILASGKHVLPQSAPVSAQMVDLVPTVLHLLDVPAPDDLDGQPLLNLFDPNSEPRTRSYKTRPADAHAAARRRIREAAAGLAAKLRKP